MSIRRLDKNKYEIRVTGYYTDGSRRFKMERFNGTKREAEMREAELLKDVGSRKIQKRDLTVKEFINEVYLPLKLENNAPITYTKYKQLCENYIFCWIGDVKLRSLNGAILDQAFSKVKTGTSYKVYQCLRSLLNIAVKYRYITDNPIKFMINPPKRIKGTKSKMRSYSIDEIIDVQDAIIGQWFEPLWLLCVFGGLRPQEACAVRTQTKKWNGRLRVSKAIGHGLNGTWEEKSTKTHNVRTVALGQEEAARIIELSGDRIGYLAQRENMIYDFVTPEEFSRDYLKFCRKNKLPYITVKDLRHTCATQMRAAGADFKDIQMVLGHEKLSTTLDNYMEELAPSTEAATMNWSAKVTDIRRIKESKNSIRKTN